MNGHIVGRYLSTSWLLLAILTLFVADFTSAAAMLLLAVVAITPPLMLQLLWRDEPSMAVMIADVTHPRSH